MSLVERVGDLFTEPDLEGLAHGCNCAGAMGKGIAIAFKERWPAMYAEYRERCERGRFRLGDVFVWEAPDRVVFNLGTQATWRTPARLEAIAESVARMAREAEARELRRVGLPRIGAGLGGLSWDAVRAVVAGVAEKTSVELVVISLPDAAGAKPTRSRRDPS